MDVVAARSWQDHPLAGLARNGFFRATRHLMPSVHSHQTAPVLEAERRRLGVLLAGHGAASVHGGLEAGREWP